MSPQQQPKAIVIGAGPAGCSAAIALAKSGIQVTILEKGKAGKDKACGDAFVPSSITLLKQYGIDEAAIQAMGGYPFHSIGLQNEDKLLWQVRYQNESGWVIPRASVDQALRDAAAQFAQIHYDTTALDIQETDTQFSIRTRTQNNEYTDTANGIVLATGASNALSQRFGISGEPTLGASISGYVHSEDLPEGLLFEFSQYCRPGYGWIFPVDGKRLNVGVCLLNRTHGKQLRQAMLDFLKAHALPDTIQWRGGGGALWSGRGQRWHHAAGIVSCGDAAGLVDPFTGEGITAALKSGEEAGLSLAEFLLQNKTNEKPLKDYSHRIRNYYSKAYFPNPLRQVWNHLCRIS